VGTWYGEEMKKGIFSMMNYWFPLEGKLSMHCPVILEKREMSASSLDSLEPEKLPSRPIKIEP